MKGGWWSLVCSPGFSIVPASNPGTRTQDHGRRMEDPMNFGSLRLDLVPGGRFRLDGGALFGVVPKVLWERSFPADDRNRVGTALYFAEALPTSAHVPIPWTM